MPPHASPRLPAARRVRPFARPRVQFPRCRRLLLLLGLLLRMRNPLPALSREWRIAPSRAIRDISRVTLRSGNVTRPWPCCHCLLHLLRPRSYRLCRCCRQLGRRLPLRQISRHPPRRLQRSVPLAAHVRLYRLRPLRQRPALLALHHGRRPRRRHCQLFLVQFRRSLARRVRGGGGARVRPIPQRACAALPSACCRPSRAASRVLPRPLFLFRPRVSRHRAHQQPRSIRHCQR